MGASQVVLTDWDTKEDVATLESAGSCNECCSKELQVASCDGASPAMDVVEVTSNEVVQLRELMKQFVQDMIRGRSYLVVVEHGKTEACTMLLTPNLQHFQL